MDIIFTDTTQAIDTEKPQPAIKLVPEWFKKTKPYLDSEKPEVFFDGKTNASIKKCIPLLDSLTSGYIITSPSDVFVSIQNGEQYFSWSSQMSIDFHPVDQLKEYPIKTPYSSYPKFVNPWSIKTPKGYSCLFIQPAHRDLPFTILTGVVDTDRYILPINFPFVMKDPCFEGIIPKGTPIAQVIPFKRQEWSIKYGSEKEFKEMLKQKSKLFSKFFDKYKSMFWDKKHYK